MPQGGWSHSGTSSGICVITSSGGLEVTIVAGAGAGSTQVHIVGAANVQAPVTSSFGLLAQVSSGSLLVVTSGTVTLSSVHTILSASSGLVQISGTITVLSASSGLIQPLATVGTSTPELSTGIQLFQMTTAGALRVTGGGAGSTQVHIVGAANVQAPVTSSFGLLTQVSSGSLIGLSSGAVTLSSQHTVTAQQGTPTNWLFVSASSGLVQISGTPTVLSASSGLVQISGTPTVTATAGTNPWSSAPGFNIPFVSASSGLLQISGTPTVTATAATNPWSSAPGFNVPIVSVSSGLVQISGTPTVTATAATNPWSSAPGFNLPIVSASSGFLQISGTPTVNINATALDPTRTFVSVTTISKVSSAPGVLWCIEVTTTSTVGGALGVPGIVRLYNATTGSVTAGANMVYLFPIAPVSTSTAAGAGGTGGQNAISGQRSFGPRGLSFGTACSIDVGTLTTGAVNVANSKACFVYTSS